MMYREEQYGSSRLVMKKLLFLLVLICSCHPKSTYVPQDWWNEDTIWVDTFSINRIYNAERMEDIFPSDTLDEGPSYEEWFTDSI